jgi:hypothetical protein
MNTISRLNVVIAELNLAAARLANGEPPSAVLSVLRQAQTHLAELTKSVGGQSLGAGETNQRLTESEIPR